VVEGIVLDGHSSQYPWTDWLDGRVWYLRMGGTDFMCLPDSMGSQARTWATLMGKSVSTRRVYGGILIQAYSTGSTWKPNFSAIDENKIRKAKDNAR
jgi:hypothetical protein